MGGAIIVVENGCVVEVDKGHPFETSQGNEDNSAVESPSERKFPRLTIEIPTATLSISSYSSRVFHRFRILGFLRLALHGRRHLQFLGRTPASLCSPYKAVGEDQNVRHYRECALLLVDPLAP